MKDKKPKITKEDLLKENVILQSEILAMKEEDVFTRQTLSELLGGYEYIRGYGYTGTDTRKIAVLDWLGIAFKIGELKADADYSVVLSAKNEFRDECAALKEKIRQLENPSPHVSK